MTDRNAKYSLDIAKVITGICALGGFIFYAGKLDEKTSNNAANIVEIKQDIKDIKSVIYQPVMAQKNNYYLTQKQK